MHYGCSGNPFAENQQVLNAHRHTEVNLRHFEGEDYENLRKNISPFDYTRKLREKSAEKANEDVNHANLKETNNILTTRDIKRGRNTLQMSRSTLCKANIPGQPLIKMQKQVHTLKSQLDSLLKQQKEITQAISKGTSKRRCETLTKQQAKIEAQRKELTGKYKKLLSADLEVPEPRARRKSVAERRKAKKSLMDDIRDNEKKLAKVLELRKENAKKLAHALEVEPADNE